MKDCCNSCDAGFTLVEVLVSMFIFSLISVGALIALSTTLNAREAAETRLDEIEHLSAMRRLMADDFSMGVGRKNRDGMGGFVRSRSLMFEVSEFEITRRGRLNPDGVFPRGDLQRISYRVENGALIRSILPHENPAYVEPPIDRVVLDGVTKMAAKLVHNGIMSLGAETVTINTYGIDVLLTHDDGTTTRHVFEMPSG